jgi:uncharacterized protein YecE (DUF72 family)
MPRKKLLRMGTAGWSQWKSDFYPKEIKSGSRLEFYAGRLSAVEINSSFYHMPREITIAKWMEQTPPDFKFCLKMSRFISHTKKLRDCEEPLAFFMGRMEILKDRMGPILIQLPASHQFNHEAIESFYALLDKYRHNYNFAIETRHLSWYEPDSIMLMEKYNITHVIADSGVKFPYREIITTKTVYLRFHGAERLYYSSYSDEELAKYALRVKTWLKKKLEVYIFFNNTAAGHAIDNLLTMEKMIEV